MYIGKLDFGKDLNENEELGVKLLDLYSTALKKILDE